ncbi:hypothetical protein ACHAXT_006226 [Thalassiosira profunda]
MPSAMSIAALIWAAVLGAAAVAECHATRSPRSAPNILVVGATGTTGLRAIQGLLDVGYAPNQLQIMTRDASKPKMRQLQKKGFGVVQGDLQRPSSLRGIGKGCGGCYIHATGGDTKELDTTEVSSAANLCDALHEDVTCIVYNSAAGAEDHGVERIQQKHDVETILSKRGSPCHVTSLRANIFGEELWKGYTRPQILDGKYPLPVHRWRKIYLTSVRDLGRLAGTIIARNAQSDESGTSMRITNVAGDRLTGPQLARAFGKAQKSKCKHVNNREMTKMARENFPDLYEQIIFLQTSKEKTNIGSLRQEFPGLVTDFSTFLEETRWGDRERVFEDLSDPESLVFGDGALATESV